ncbi:hypothetical protein HMPREF1624_05077 [Sporothrix schenckii ATCC 58251]|uniref:Uncharacterized protein n=1 Tax=Sporothrix schenckii (strain ATCC 58251 / de Perez 2211183) TaxID=1391915 RepID=U7PRL6_SPOS1|nr:hypothetical protein HMPREF1624_05077 [Sporothrix schenckii ATCC 58251]
MAHKAYKPATRQLEATAYGHDDVNRVPFHGAGTYVPVNETHNSGHAHHASIDTPKHVSHEPPIRIDPAFTQTEIYDAEADCAACGAIHVGNSGDVPAVKSAEARLATFCMHGESDLVLGHLAWGYRLKYHHMVFAVHMSMSGTFPEYRHRLLRPYQVSSKPDACDVAIKQFVRPIVTVTERCPSFLLYRSTQVSRHDGPQSEPLDSISIGHLYICPHANVTGADHVAAVTNSAIENAIANANMGISAKQHLSCRRCPTDIELVSEPGCVTVRSWHNMGYSNTTPTSPEWMVHVVSPGNNEFVGPVVRHRQGSIRARYERAIQQQDLNNDVYTQDDENNPMTSAALRIAGRTLLGYRVQGRRELRGY